MIIDLEKLNKYLNEQYIYFTKSRDECEFENTKEFYDGLASGMKNVMEFISDNLDYLKYK